MLNVTNDKIKVLIFIGHYLPGFKSGGILRSIENTVNNLYKEFDFFIVTRDHDLGDAEAYKDIKVNEWLQVGHSYVNYLDSKASSFNSICSLVNETSHNVIYLNSFFDTLTIKVLLGCKLGKISDQKIILSPRGEFAWASLKIRYLKKLIYIMFSKFINLFNTVTWHVSSKYEAQDLIDVMNVRSSSIHIAKDLPVNYKVNFFENNDKLVLSDELRVIFLSRISPEKNLDFAIQVLSKITCNIVFDIYGMLEDETYWNKCKKLIKFLPENIIVHYHGVISPDKVVDTFSKYDLFFFPSGGENYGHVIAESLSAGTPVLISKNTPWLELDKKGLGWDIDLSEANLFVSIIEKLSSLSKAKRLSQKVDIIHKSKDILSNKGDYEDNRKLFLNTLV